MGTRFAHLLLLLLLAWAAPPARAQTDPAQVEALRAELEQATGLTAEARQGASSALDQAAAALAARDEARQEQARFSDDARAARERLERDGEDGQGVEPPAAPPSDASPETLRAAERRLQAELDVAEERAASLRSERTQLETRERELPEELARARQVEQEARQRAAVDPQGTDAAARARRLLATAQVEQASAEVAALEAEQAYVTARLRLLPSLRESNDARVEALGQVLEGVEGRLESAREEQAREKAREEAELLRGDITQRYPALTELAGENQELVERLADVRERQRTLMSGAGPDADPSQPIQAGLSALEDRQAELIARYYATREKVSKAGLAGALGVVLQRELGRLPSPGSLRRRAGELRRTIAEDQLFQIEMEEERGRLARMDAAVDEVLAGLRGDTGDQDRAREAVAEVVRDILTSRLETVTWLARDVQTLVDDETEYSVTLEGTADLAEEFREFIAERILWVRSPPSERWVSFTGLTKTIEWALDTTAWRKAGSNALSRAVAAPLVPLLLLALSALALARTRHLRRRLVALADQARSFRTDGIHLTVKALAVSIALASPLGLLLLLAAWLLGTPAGQPDVALAAAAGLQRSAFLAGAGALLFVTTRPRGLGEVHLRWPAAACRHLRVHLTWILPVGISLATVGQILEANAAPDGSSAFARLALGLGQLLLTGFLWLVLRAQGPLFEDAFKRNPGSLLQRTAWAWFSLAMVFPFAIAVMALLGYGYGARELSQLVGNSLVLVIVVVIGYGLLLRWLYVVRRRLLVDQARQRASARVQEEGGDPTAATINEDEVDVASVDQQTRQLFRTGSLATVAIGLYLIWAGALPALHVLERVELWPTLRVTESTATLPESEILDRIDGSAVARTVAAGDGGGSSEAGEGDDAAGSAGASSAGAPTLNLAETVGDTAPAPLATVITLGNVLGAIVALLAMGIAARNLPGLLEVTLLKRLPVDNGSRYAISALLRYGIVVVGATVALGAIGIGWSNVQWLAAALTFGLGFGLQEIFANFVSGLILLLERPIRVGDVVTVAGIEGRVTQIHMRSTTITDWNMRELLVPNREFITASLINWTLSDPTTRVVVPVGVAYGSDTRKARALLLHCARETKTVVESPAPSAIFREFGDSALLFELRVYIRSRDHWPELINEIHQRIDDAFREAGIEIAFPQRDLHLRTIGPLEEALRPRIEPASTPPPEPRPRGGPAQDAPAGETEP